MRLKSQGSFSPEVLKLFLAFLGFHRDGTEEAGGLEEHMRG